MVCSLLFVLSTNLYMKDQQDMNIFIFFFYKIILVLGNQGSIIENVIHPFNLKTLNCDQNTYSVYLKF